MREIRLAIPAQPRSYDILVGRGLIKQVPTLLSVENYSSLFVVTDEHLSVQWLPQLSLALPPHDVCVVAAGESAKTLASVEQIWAAMTEAGLDRKGLVIILGGGVLGDLAAFAAATYKRGVAFAQIPTTLVAQADSSVGGKTGFDYQGLKNLIGTFSQPQAVLADTEVLRTLPERELIAGFGEMFKHACIADPKFLKNLTAKAPTSYSPSEMANLIATSIRIKARIVSGDETEAGARKLLNFGHTVGHAAESLSWDTGRPLLHGEAVAIGMVAEAKLSCRIGRITGADVTRLANILSAAGLPIDLPSFSPSQLLAKMRADKKNADDRINFTLLTSLGEAVINQTVDEQELVDVLTTPLEEYREH
jgi:3-dehydroquinate synthase